MNLEIQKLNSLIEDLKSETMQKLTDERREHQSVIDDLTAEHKRNLIDINLENKKQNDLLITKLKDKTTIIEDYENKYINDKRPTNIENENEIESESESEQEEISLVNQNKVNELLFKSNA